MSRCDSVSRTVRFTCLSNSAPFISETEPNIFLLVSAQPTGALASAQTFTRLVTFILQVDGAKRLSGCPREQALLFLFSLGSSPFRRRFGSGDLLGQLVRRHIPVPAVFSYYVALTVWSNHDAYIFRCFSRLDPCLVVAIVTSLHFLCGSETHKPCEYYMQFFGQLFLKSNFFCSSEVVLHCLMLKPISVKARNLFRLRPSA
jgi:hypothetical protein